MIDLLIQMGCIELFLTFSMEYGGLSINWMQDSQFSAVQTICLLTLCWPSWNELWEVIRWTFNNMETDLSPLMGYLWKWQSIRHWLPKMVAVKTMMTHYNFWQIRLPLGILARIFPVWFLNCVNFKMTVKICN